MEFSKCYSFKGAEWNEKDVFPFNELILSWNGQRPNGKWTFWVSLKENEWLKYAEWSQQGQKTFKSVGSFAQSYQDAVVCKELCREFRIKVEGDELEKLHTLHVCLSHTEEYKILNPGPLKKVLLNDVAGQSQIVLDHPRNKDLCSPTSTSTALSYLCKKRLDPLFFANRVRDEEFDIYGNWILNVAEAYHQSGIPCRVERLAHFGVLHGHLMKGKPVVVSVKGPIPGAPQPYQSGHLLCVIGFDGEKVYCIDSAFKTNESTFFGYDWKDFQSAWGRRRNLSYIFL